jgi:hypothetical protein
MKHPAHRIKWRTTEDSSNVTRVGWDDGNNLYVTFKGGTTYMYVGVSRQRVVAIATRVASVGRYINKVIKPNYKAVKIG